MFIHLKKSIQNTKNNERKMFRIFRFASNFDINKKANKYKLYNCIKYWRSGQLNFVQVTEVFPTVSK